MSMNYKRLLHNIWFILLSLFANDIVAKVMQFSWATAPLVLRDGQLSAPMSKACAALFGEQYTCGLATIQPGKALEELNKRLQGSPFLRPTGSLRCQMMPLETEIQLVQNPELCTQLTQLGLLSAVKPKYKTYECIIIHPGEIIDWQDRISFALQLLFSSGIKCKRLVMLVGSRILQPEEFSNQDDLVTFLKILGYDVPSSENNLFEFFRKQAISEEQAGKALLSQAISQHSLSSFQTSSLKNKLEWCIDQSAGSNTLSTLKHFLTGEGTLAIGKKKYLFISNNPFIGRQHWTVLQAISEMPREMGLRFNFETAGPGVHLKDLQSPKFTAILRDDFIRLIYTLKQRLLNG